MNKVDFARRLATRLQISNYESINYLNAFINELESALSEGEPICFQNFGTFAPWYQAARAGRNPRSGVSHPIPARTSVKFKAGTGLLKKMNTNLLGLLWALLITLSVTGCSAELPNTEPEEELIPIEINSGVAGMTIASSDTRAGEVELPPIVKTTFVENDEIKLTITKQDGTIETTTLVYNKGKWQENIGGTIQEFKRNKSYDKSSVVAEYGTTITEKDHVSPNDYLKTDTKGTLSLSNKTFTCRLIFDHQYPCITVKEMTNSNLMYVYISQASISYETQETVFADTKEDELKSISYYCKGGLTTQSIPITPRKLEKNYYYILQIYIP